MKDNKPYLWIALVLGVGCVLFVFRKILIYLMLAAVIGFIGDPLVDRIQAFKVGKRNIPRWLGALFFILLLLSAVSGLAILFIPLIRTEIDVIGSLNALQVEQQLRSQFPNLAAGLDSMGYGQGAFATTLMDTQSHLSFSGISSWFGDIIGWITGFVGGVFSVIFMSFFFLKDEDLFARILEAITPDVHLSKVNNIVLHTKKTLSRYFGGLLIQTAIMGLMVGSGLYFTGVPNAGLFGLVSALLNVVPYIGPAMAYLLTLVMGVSTQIACDPNADLGHVVSMTTLIFAIAQLLDAILIQPYIVGSSIRVHPLELFIVLMAAASVGGIPAMGIALPAYAILRIAAREWLTEYKWVKQLTKNL